MPRRAAKHPPAKRPLRILVVDDCTDTLSCFDKILKHNGFEVATAFNADRAIEMAKKNHPDVLVMDVNLPVVDGYDLAEEVMLHLSYKPLCIAMTGFSKQRPRSEAFQEGFSFYFVKPVNATELVDVIRKYGAPN